MRTLGNNRMLLAQALMAHIPESAEPVKEFVIQRLPEPTLPCYADVVKLEGKFYDKFTKKRKV